MAMLPGLQLNVSQQLKLTPQLQQSIKILQYSAIELQQAIEEALDNNIMLEVELDEAFESREPDRYDEAPNIESDDWSDNLKQLELSSNQNDIDHTGNLTETLDCQWDDLFSDDNNGRDNANTDLADFSVSSYRDDEEYLSPESYTAAPEDLYEHLKWQVDTFSFHSDQDQTIAYYLIDAVNEQGYLGTTLENIAQDMIEHESFHADINDIQRVLKLIQDNFEPSGIAARDIQECLLIQLNGMIPKTEVTETAVRMLSEKFDWFAHGDFVRLKRLYARDDKHWDAILERIKSCSPKPGLRYANSESEIIVPDLIIKRDKKGWKIELNSRAYPKVRVNSEYVDLLKQVDKTTTQNEQIETMKEKLLEARGLMKSIQSRGETLLKVAAYLVAEQARFLDEGDIAMKPMVLRVVADALGLHESTISRATTQKYIQTPRGTYELKYFFSSSVSQYGPQDQSAVAIKSRIKTLIDAEDPKKPISDQDLVDKLEEMKISVARRTIAKYREAMGIASSSQRKVRR
jgi:RNA polymerase sigma-54 factor